MEHGERGSNHLSKRAGSQRTSSTSQPQTEREEEERGKKRFHRQAEEEGKKSSGAACRGFESKSVFGTTVSHTHTHLKKQLQVWEFKLTV